MISAENDCAFLTHKEILCISHPATVGSTCGIALDKEGFVYVVDYGSDRDLDSTWSLSSAFVIYMVSFESLSEFDVSVHVS